MKLKDRRTFLVKSRMREVLMDSDKGIGVLIDRSIFDLLDSEFSREEVSYTLRYLDGKGYFKMRSDGAGYTITALGYDEWLFPDGYVSSNSVFISYATGDAALASTLKRELESVGLNIFLAHEDIEPTEKWRDKVINDLRSSTTFIALRTKKYLGRPYTEQECGFALALNKRILTLSIGTDTTNMGFCSEFQGEKFEENETEKMFEFCKKQLTVD